MALSLSPQGMFGAPLLPDQRTMPAAAPRISGFDAPGGTADTLRSLAGRLMQIGGLPQAGTSLLQDVQQRQDSLAQVAAEQRRQAAQYAMWQQQKEWERANPAAPQPTEFERTVQAAGIIPGTPEYAQIMRQRAENQASAPPMVVTNPDGTRTVYPSGSIPRGPMTPPSAPVGKLTPMGGASPQGLGGFPLR